MATGAAATRSNRRYAGQIQSNPPAELQNNVHCAYFLPFLLGIFGIL